MGETGYDFENIPGGAEFEFSVADFIGTHLSTTPMLVEGLLFTLICFILTVLSVSLDGEDSDGALSFLS